MAAENLHDEEAASRINHILINIHFSEFNASTNIPYTLTSKI
jgi:hypothetical protein